MDLITKPRVALVTPYGPILHEDGPKNGATVRTTLFAKELAARGWEVTILSFGEVLGPNQLHRDGVTEITCVAPWTGALQLASRAWARFRRKSHAGRELLAVFDAPARPLDGASQAALRTAHVVHVDFPWLMPTIARALQGSTPIAMTCHNVEHDRYAQIAHNAAPAPARLLWDAVLARRFEAFERAQARNADGLICVTEQDAARFAGERRGHSPIVVSPNPVRPRLAPLTDEPRDARAIFVGSALQPNVDAAYFLCSTLAPALPEVQFTIVGGCGLSLAGTPSNVTISGVVDDVSLQRLYDAHRVAIIPLTTGSGSSTKTIEALAHGLPVVTTATGARGLPSAAEAIHVVRSLPDLTDALARAISQPWTLDHARAAQSVARGYHPERVFADVDALLHELAHRAKG